VTTWKGLVAFAYNDVIAGAVSAGCVPAAWLTEDPAVRVALVEARGVDTAPEIGLPIAFPQLFNTQYVWDFSSEPESGLSARRLYLPRGKMLGGCSSINATTYVRGRRADFHGWVEEGAPGWSYGEMLPTSSSRRGTSAGGKVRRRFTSSPPGSHSRATPEGPGYGQGSLSQGSADWRQLRSRRSVQRVPARGTTAATHFSGAEMTR
jgi:choline dehydrogenase-like flavoprotein